MDLYRSPEDPELYEKKNTDATYFVSSMLMASKESVSLFPKKSIFKRLQKASHLCQQTGTIRAKFLSPYLLML